MKRQARCPVEAREIERIYDDKCRVYGPARYGGSSAERDIRRPERLMRKMGSVAGMRGKGPGRPPSSMSPPSARPIWRTAPSPRLLPIVCGRPISRICHAPVVDDLCRL